MKIAGPDSSRGYVLVSLFVLVINSDQVGQPGFQVHFFADSIRHAGVGGNSDTIAFTIESIVSTPCVFTDIVHAKAPLAKNNALSKEIGELFRQKKTDEANEKKKEVERLKVEEGDLKTKLSFKPFFF